MNGFWLDILIGSKVGGISTIIDAVFLCSDLVIRQRDDEEKT